jgi:hypothetical protein
VGGLVRGDRQGAPPPSLHVVIIILGGRQWPLFPVIQEKRTQGAPCKGECYRCNPRCQAPNQHECRRQVEGTSLVRHRRRQRGGERRSGWTLVTAEGWRAPVWLDTGVGLVGLDTGNCGGEPEKGVHQGFIRTLDAMRSNVMLSPFRRRSSDYVTFCL